MEDLARNIRGDVAGTAFFAPERIPLGGGGEGSRAVIERNRGDLDEMTFDGLASGDVPLGEEGRRGLGGLDSDLGSGAVA